MDFPIASEAGVQDCGIGYANALRLSHRAVDLLDTTEPLDTEVLARGPRR